MPAPRIRQYVRTDLHTDQRVHKWALSLQALGWAVETVGQGTRPLPSRPYQTWLLPPTRSWLAYQRQLREDLHQAPAVDLVLAHDLDTLPALYQSCRRQGIPLLHDAHEYWSQQHLYHRRPLERFAWAWLEHRYYPMLAPGSTVSAPIQAEFAKVYGWSTAVIPNHPLAQSAPQTSPEGRRQARIVLYQGQLLPGRGLELLLPALAHLPPDVRMWILGEGPLRPNLLEEAASLGLTDRVWLPGAIPFAELTTHTRQASLGLSLEWGASANVQWSSPNKLYDYAQAHLPVVVSDLPLHRAHVQNYGCGVVLLDRQPEQLAAAIRALLDAPEAYQAAATGAGQAALHCTWERNLPTIEALVQGALHGWTGSGAGSVGAGVGSDAPTEASAGEGGGTGA